MRNRLALFSMGLVLLSVFVGSFPVMAQTTLNQALKLQWNGVQTQRWGADTLYYLSLESAEYEGKMPVFRQSFPIYDDAVKAKVELLNVKTAPLSEEEMKWARDYELLPEFEVAAMPLRSRDEALLSVRIVPLRQAAGRMEKLLSATLSVTLTPDFSRQKANPT